MRYSSGCFLSAHSPCTFKPHLPGSGHTYPPPALVLSLLHLLFVLLEMDTEGVSHFLSPQVTLQGTSSGLSSYGPA